MKRLILLLLLAGGSGLVWAQTNHVATATVKAPAKPAPPTEVDSDNAEFDMGSAKTPRQAIYRGNVRVTDPKIKLWCEWLKLDLPPGNGHVSTIVADTNVVIDFTGENGEQYHVTSEKAVYDYKVVGGVTNETVTWTGNPIVTNKDFTIWSEPLVWDRKANKFFFTKPRVIAQQGLSAGGTNSSGLKLY